ncbi:hypothetical protein BCR41DRAFT_400073 [Lobosporangium transversale]|uniref:Uncharacterized protein n=1 Tax=Lobosporangium transversale TaxID=64571 RepID=A0A1Y2GE67_9FUNG|nr:hypothetical protein BCR41DRAFT_400073 [Lobosporangium transversale]ORZ06559.1 hypothetical protein BCR41DRAFT_400073 [Lobosporangium transversale]|eukprot:XP_021877602.1 hypothetical protein BCR41DRAFT_400073 [Lobosporangium transversale]
MRDIAGTTNVWNSRCRKTTSSLVYLSSTAEELEGSLSSASLAITWKFAESLEIQGPKMARAKECSRVSTQFLAMGAIAYAATAVAKPSFTKRAIDGSKVLAWTSDCATAAATDFSLARETMLNDLSIDFTNPDPMAMGLSSSSSDMKLVSIPRVSWPIKNIAGLVTITNDGVAIAEFEAPSTPEVKGAILKAAIGNTILRVIPGQEEAFSKFSEALISKSSHTFTVSGNIDIGLKVSGISLFSGPNGAAPSASSKILTATNVGFSSIATLRACEHILVKPMSLVSLKKDAASGAVESPNLVLDIGDNVVAMTMTSIDPDFYTILTTKSNTFTITGFEGSVKNPILVKAMHVFRISLTIPRIEVA